MPGKFYDGVTGSYAGVVESKAFCEGRQAKVFGESGGNPHATGSNANAAWAAGYALDATSGAAGPCNIFAGVTVPNVVGMTTANATAALANVGLRVESVALTNDPIASQVPAAAAKARYNSSVALTRTS